MASMTALLVTLSISLTALSNEKCAKITAQTIKLKLDGDLYKTIEILEHSVEVLSLKLNSLYGDNPIINAKLAELLNETTQVNRAIEQLTEKVLGEQTISKAELDHLSYRIVEVATTFNYLAKQSRIELPEQGDIPIVETNTNSIALTKRAEKEANNLQPHLRSKFDEFVKDISVVNGPSELSRQWMVEQIGYYDMGALTNGYSVRLNSGYRVIFEFSAETGVSVVSISKTATH